MEVAGATSASQIRTARSNRVEPASLKDLPRIDTAGTLAFLDRVASLRRSLEALSGHERVSVPQRGFEDPARFERALRDVADRFAQLFNPHRFDGEPELKATARAGLFDAASKALGLTDPDPEKPLRSGLGFELDFSADVERMLTLDVNELRRDLANERSFDELVDLLFGSPDERDVGGLIEQMTDALDVVVELAGKGLEIGVPVGLLLEAQA